MTQQVTLGGGRSSAQCILVGILDDKITEDMEEFQLHLYLNDSHLQAEGQLVLFPDSVTISIIDDDSKSELLMVRGVFF